MRTAFQVNLNDEVRQESKKNLQGLSSPAECCPVSPAGVRGSREAGVVGPNGDMWYDLAVFSSSTQGWLKVSADDYKWN